MPIIRIRLETQAAVPDEVVAEVRRLLVLRGTDWVSIRDVATTATRMANKKLAKTCEKLCDRVGYDFVITKEAVGLT